MRLAMQTLNLKNKKVLLSASLIIWIAISKLFHGKFTLELAAADKTAFQKQLGAWADSFDADRNSNPLFIYFLTPIRQFVDGFVKLIQSFISTPVAGSKIPILGWLGVFAVILLVVFLISNIRIVIFTAFALFSCGALGLWRPTMDTLALTLASVVLSLIIGIPLGIWAGLSDRALRIFTPIMDFAQIMPTFVYLTPLTLVFLIGPASATIATMIYAIPPAIRITSYGIRHVPVTAIEASDSMGTTKWQKLFKVQLPLAKQTIVVGINQTIMAAVSFVTIAALIDAPGLGKDIIRALQVLNVGKGFVAGTAIVLIAIMLDRATSAAAKDADRNLKPKSGLIRNPNFHKLVAVVLTVVAVILSRQQLWAAIFPTSLDVSAQVADFINSLVMWLKENVYFLTDGFKNLITMVFLNPLQWLLEGTPWFINLGIFVFLAFLIGGKRPGVIMLINFLLIAAIGLWQDSMVTLAQVFVASILTIGLGVALGVWVGRNSRVDRLLRPILDAGQTMPAFVFLVPLLGLFGPTRFTAIIAAVVYAAPVVVKIVADGIKGIPTSMIESAISSGVTNWQMIKKVQVPAIRRSLVLASNQGLIYVLAMVVVGGLVGGGALGYDVINGFAQLQLKGKGLAAGIAIVLMGIAIDRITQSKAKSA